MSKVEADLKGAPFGSLRSETLGGVSLEPLYVAEDAVEATGVPGGFPFLRGASPLGGWKVRQEYEDVRPSDCADRISRDLSSGVEALWVRLGPRLGCRVFTVDDLEIVFGSVDLSATSICLEAGSDSLALAAGFVALAERRQSGAERLQGCFGLDPIGVLAREGQLEGGLRARLAELRDLGVWCSEHAPSMRALCVSSEAYHDGGGSSAQELAASIATGVEYLRQLTDAGLTVDAAARQILFRYPVSGEFFEQIAKLRAARSMWARVVVAAGGEPRSGAMEIHATTSAFTKTRRDPWVNMLRATSECAAAVFGGAQSIATLPFDVAIGPSDELAERIARNTQIVLREESHLAAVADPAGGSWFIEKLSLDMAREAWEAFRAIEREGGITKSLGSGRMVADVEAAAATAQTRIAKRKTSLVGVSEFPNLGEPSLERQGVGASEMKKLLEDSLDALDVGAQREPLIAIAKAVESPERAPGTLMEACVAAATNGVDLYSVATVLKHGQPDFHLEPVHQWRQAEPWERLRDRMERHVNEHGSRPEAFLANLGPIPAHKARSTWAQNLLATAGIGAITNDGFDDPNALGAAFVSSGASMAVICGSDRDYETRLDAAVRALVSAGCDVVLVAGRPGDREPKLREAGVTDFAFVGTDVLQVMRRAIEAMGVSR